MRKFTQDLTIEVVAGTKAQRRKLIAAVAQQWKNPSESNDMQRTDVVITSYDLLRRDVDDYAACRFALMALDEAQYIKTMPRSWRKPSNRSPPNTGSH